MPLPTPILDDRSYQQLRDELVRRIPVYAPEWTDHNPSDPGITLVELFAFLGENLLYRFNQIPDSTKLEFLRLLRIPLRAAVPATGMIALSTDVASGVLAPIKSQARAGKLPFETETEVLAWPLVISGMGRLLPDTGAPTGDAATFAQNAIDAVVAQAASFKKKLALDMKTAAFYVTVPLPSDPAAPGATAVDFGKAVDNALWIAVQKTDKTDFNQLYNALVNVGFVPDEQVVSMADVLPCPGTGVTTPVPQIVWQVSTGQLSAADGSPIYRELIPEGDTTRGLSQSGVVRLRLPRDVGGLGNFTIADPDLVGTGDLPPPIEDQSVAANVIFWLRAYRMDGGSLGRILWVGANAAEVIQTTTANTEFLGVGNAQPNQQYGLVNQQVIPSSLVIEVEDADGFKPWTQVDDFLASGEGDTHYVLDPEAGVVTFGNGVQGYAPQIGQRIRATTYRYGGGLAGNLPAGSISKMVDVTGVKANNPLPSTGGADPETLDAALARIPGEFRRHDRAVAASDFQELAMMTPGAQVGRAEVLPLFYPPNASSFNPADPSTFAAGVVSVMVWPNQDPKHPDAPQPDTNMLRAVCTWLDARRLVTTELYVIPPTYKVIAVAIGLEAQDGYGIEAVRRWVELAVRQYLAPLPPYGPTGSGWPLGRRVYGPEIEAAATQVEGVDFLYPVNLAYQAPDPTDATKTIWVPFTPPAGADVCTPQTIALAPYEVVQLAELTVVQGQPLPAGVAIAPPSTSTPPVPIPTLTEEC